MSTPDQGDAPSVDSDIVEASTQGDAPPVDSGIVEASTQGDVPPVDSGIVEASTAVAALVFTVATLTSDRVEPVVVALLMILGFLTNYAALWFLVLYYHQKIVKQETKGHFLGLVEIIKMVFLPKNSPYWLLSVALFVLIFMFYIQAMFLVMPDNAEGARVTGIVLPLGLMAIFWLLGLLLKMLE